MANPAYLPARTLPIELLEHVIIYFDEGLWSSCLNLLRSVAVARYHGNHLTHDDGYAFVPNAHILALLATLSVHPSMTTRAASVEDGIAAEESLNLLTHINELIGPKNAGLEQAFLFASSSRTGSHRKLNKRQRVREDADSEDHAMDNSSSDEKESLVSDDRALDDGLFSRADDFWHVLGWAMNCAAKYPKRWAVWKPWLELHLTILEDDWKLRVAHWTSSESSNDSERRMLQDSLMMQYLKGASIREGRNAQRRMLRSIFAHGDKTDLQEFREIFRNELKDRKAKEDNIGKRKLIDLDQDDWGDYYDNDEEEEVEIKNEDGSRRRITTRKWNDALDKAVGILKEDVDDDRHPFEIWGGFDALRLRKRVLVLVRRRLSMSRRVAKNAVKLSEVSRFLPLAFVPLDDLADTYAEFIKSLPLPIFSFFMRPPPPSHRSRQSEIVAATKLGEHYHPQTYIKMIQSILQPLTATGSAIRKANPSKSVPDLEELRTKLLALTATSKAIRENSMVSCLLEGLLRVMLQHSQSIFSSPEERQQQQQRHAALLPAGRGLEDEISHGVRCREFKTFNKKNQGEREAKAWLVNSETILEVIAKMIEHDAKNKHSNGTQKESEEPVPSKVSIPIGAPSSSLSSLPSSALM